MRKAKISMAVMVLTFLVGVLTWASGAVVANDVLVDGGESNRMEKWWLIAEGAKGIERTKDIAFSGEYSLKLTYDLNGNQQWATYHNNYYEYNDLEVLQVAGWTLQVRVYNPNKEAAGKLMFVAVIMDAQQKWYWLDWFKRVDASGTAGNRLGWSGDERGNTAGGDGWYLYEAKVPDNIKDVFVIQVKVHLPDKELSFGPSGPGPNYIYIDDLKFVQK